MPLFRPLFLAAKFLALKIASQKTEKCGRIQHVSPSRQPMVQQAKNFLFRLVLLNVALLNHSLKYLTVDKPPLVDGCPVNWNF